MVAPHFCSLYSSLRLCVRVNDSQAEKEMDVTMECISCTLEMMEMLLSF